MTPPPSTSLAVDAVARFVAGEGWAVEPLHDGAVMTTIEGRHGAWACILTPLADDEVVVIESIAPLVVPPDKLLVVAELVARVNDDLLLGAFTIDFDAGSVRARDSIDLEPLVDRVDDPAGVAAALMATPVATNLATMDRWLTAITVVVHGDTLPLDAVIATEQRPID